VLVLGLEQLHRGGARLVAGVGNLVAGQSLVEAPCLEEAFQVVEGTAVTRQVGEIVPVAEMVAPVVGMEASWCQA